MKKFSVLIATFVATLAISSSFEAKTVKAKLVKSESQVMKADVISAKAKTTTFVTVKIPKDGLLFVGAQEYDKYETTVSHVRQITTGSPDVPAETQNKTETTTGNSPNASSEETSTTSGAPQLDYAKETRWVTVVTPYGEMQIPFLDEDQDASSGKSDSTPSGETQSAPSEESSTTVQEETQSSQSVSYDVKPIVETVKETVEGWFNLKYAKATLSQNGKTKKVGSKTVAMPVKKGVVKLVIANSKAETVRTRFAFALLPDSARTVGAGKTYIGAAKSKKSTLMKLKLKKKSKVTFAAAGAGTFEILNAKKKVIKSYPCVKLAPSLVLSNDGSAKFSMEIQYPISKGEDLLKKVNLKKGTYYLRFCGAKGPTKLSFKVKALKK